MQVLSGRNLSRTLRSACDSAQQRLWIASPYVGGWQEVRRIVGRNWWDDTRIGIRLLTDGKEGGLNRTTAQRFDQRGDIRDLRGLHAKLYIVDDSVLLTSANLTGAGFAKRYETGIWLTGSSAH